MSLLITLPVVSASRSAPVVLKEPQVLAAPAVPSHAIFEACGRAFHVAALGADAVQDATTEVEITAGGLNLKDEKWEILRNKKIDLEDYYGLLGLEDKSWRATTDEIKNAFRIVSLVCHPDKASPDNREYAEARFKALQKGHEILTDPTKRRGYDSSLPFDDSLPTDKQGLAEKDFFKMYEPVFMRNERFSTVQPCPSLGNMDTPDDQVFAFYDFWFNFKSWREYSHLDEHKINDGTGREEKRWMLRENQKKQAGKKKEELARIRKLAEDAQKKDPRIARFRKREEEEKLKKKMAKTEGARAQAEAAAKAKAEEEARLAEEKRQKEEQENREREQKKQLKSVRSYFGKFCREAGLSEEDIEKLKGVLSFDQFNEIVTEFRADKTSAKGLQLFETHLEHFFKDEMAARKVAAPKVEKVVKLAEPVAEVEETNSAWAAEEEQALIKAVIKFPGGALQRWEKITDAVNAVGKKSQKEVIRKAKEMESKPPTIDQEAAFQKYLQRMHKDQQGAELSRLRNMNEEDARAFVKQQNELHEAEQERLANEAAETERQRLAAEEEKKRALKAKADEKLRKMQERERLEEERLAAEAKKNDPKKKGGKQAAPAPQPKKEAAPVAAAPAADAAAPAAAAAPTSEEWTYEEQARLEKALATIAKEVEGRWELIAKEVQTKDKKQCQAHYKVIREQVIKAKGADAAGAGAAAPKAQQAQNQPKGGAAGGNKRK